MVNSQFDRFTKYSVLHALIPYYGSNGKIGIASYVYYIITCSDPSFMGIGNKFTIYSVVLTASKCTVYYML